MLNETEREEKIEAWVNTLTKGQLQTIVNDLISYAIENDDVAIHAECDAPYWKHSGEVLSDPETDLIQAWLEADYEADEANELRDKALEAAREVPVPPMDKLRPATAADMVEGQIVWYPDGKFWKWIACVDYPYDRFKAYTANDGCRYGLEGAYVEIEN